jgi:hypothetical protein
MPIIFLLQRIGALTLVFLLVTLGQVALAGINDGLVAYYPFNGNANDARGELFNGTVYGASLAPDQFGDPARAYKFDGIDDYIGLGYNWLTNPDQNRTICAWVSESDTTTSDSTIVHNGRIRGQCTLGVVDGKAYFSVLLRDFQLYIVQDDTPLPVNEFVHLVGTYEFCNACPGPDSFIKLWINGKLKKVFSIPNLPLYYYGSAYQWSYIGATYKSGQSDYPEIILGSFWKGIIDEVRIYDRALSAAEIQELYALKNRSIAPLISLLFAN